MISFNKPCYIGNELDYIKKAIDNSKLCGDGEFTKKSSEWLRNKTGVSKVLLTTSCTHALEIATMLIDIKPGDEVIMPSFTFASTADAIAMRGGAIVFVDIKPETMNIDESLIKEAITDKTKAIYPVHYAGVGCNMDEIMQIAKNYHLHVVEDAAQGVMSEYKGRALGSIGDFGCFSFHETKNYCMGEGGALLIRDQDNVEKAEILREKGTNRSKFFRGEVDKYTWVDKGSSYLPSELNAAYLYAQLEKADEILNDRLKSWNSYYGQLKCLADSGIIELPFIPEYCKHNGHIFYIKTKNLEERTLLLSFLKDNGIHSVFHYVPLHSSPAGKKYGRFFGEDIYTTKESERLLRLPMFYGLTEEMITYVCEIIKKFYKY